MLNGGPCQSYLHPLFYITALLLVSVKDGEMNHCTHKKMDMKKRHVLYAAILLVAFTACKGINTQSQKDAAALTAYVDSVENLTPVYTAAYWAGLENGYEARIAKAEMAKADLKEADQERLDESKAKYAALKLAYETNIREAEARATSATDFRQVLRNKLFGEGVVGNDMSFRFATPANLLSVYRNFVNTVDANKNSYSREDWDEIKVLYEALDNRKNTIEKDLPKGDNNQIAGLKVKFATIKATHRGGTKAQENQDAKDKAE